MSTKEKDTKEQKDNLIQDKAISTERVKLKRSMRILIFLTFIFESIAMSGDNGVTSSSSKEIKKDLGMNNAQYGMFGSLPSTGRICGSLMFMGLLYTDNRKLLTVCTLLVNGGAYFIYLITKNKFILYGVRFVIGSVRVFSHIYIPIWVDQFGVRSLKTLMMTVINITSPLGQTLGYAVGTFNKKEEWPKNYALLGGLILGVGIIIFLSPSEYFSARYTFIGYEDGEKLVETANSRTSTSIFKSDEIKRKQTGGSMLSILANPSYILSAFSRSNLLFIFQVIHLFIRQYVSDALKIEDNTEILIYYGTATLFGPPCGGSFGGIVTTFFGGYENKNSALVLVCFGILTLCSAMGVAFFQSMLPLGLGLFCFFFFASAMLPTIVGYVIASIPREHKGAGSSLNMLISTLGGNFPGPIIYGFLNDKFGETSPSFAWRCVMFYYVIGFVAVCFAATSRYKQLSAIEKAKGTPANRPSKSKEHIGDAVEGQGYGEPNDKLKAKPKPGATDKEMQNKNEDDEDDESDDQ